MNIRMFYILAAALPFIFLAGCNGVGSSSSMQREIDTLKMEVADLKDKGRIGDMRGSYGGGTEVGELRSQVQRLTESVEASGMGGMTLRQQLEYVNARLDRLEKKTGLKTLDTKVIDSNVPVVTGGSSYPGSANNPYQSQTSDPYATSGGAASDGASAAAGYPQSAGSGPYEDGKALFEQKDYKGAITQLQAYLKAEPKGTNAPAAHFYIGESLYGQQKYEEAILEYQKVIKNFPKSSHVSTALLKQGISFQSIGDKESAKLIYNKIVKSYPKSYAAGVAKERLKTI